MKRECADEAEVVVGHDWQKIPLTLALVVTHFPEHHFRTLTSSERRRSDKHAIIVLRKAPNGASVPWTSPPRLDSLWTEK